MERDYPAAHSMDTCWFATDRDGHLGYFATGEAGAMPVDIDMPDDPDDLRDRLAALLPRTEAVHDLTGRSCPGPLGKEDAHEATDVYPDESYVFFLKSAEPVRREIERGQAVRVPGHGGLAFVIKGVTKALSKRLHAAGACLGCFLHWDAEGDEPPEPAAFGLFCYNHLTENWISGPYGRQARPLQPAHIDQLPPDVRDELRVFTLDLSFVRRPYIQPVEQGYTTTSWEPAYLTGDGKRIRENRPAIDEDMAPDEYAEIHEGLVDPEDDWLKGIAIDPPRHRG